MMVATGANAQKLPPERTITTEQRITIRNQLDESIPPRQIIGVIKKSDPTLLIILRDLYNRSRTFVRVLGCF